MSAVAILSPGFPQASGGVTDHTTRLAISWRAVGHDVIVLADPDEAPATLQTMPGLDGLLIQYVPFLYGPRGLSPLPRRITRLARRRGIRVTLFVHEPWVPPTRLPWLLLSPLQRRQLRRLLVVADAAVTPVPAWARMLGGTVHTLAVGSTLPPPLTIALVEDPLPAPVVFSPFASGLRWDWIAAAQEAVGTSPPLIVIGATAEEARANPQTAPFVTAAQDWRGHLPADEVVALLARAQLVLAPFADGMTGRRTSAMAALSTGARLVGAAGPLSDPVFETGPIPLAADRETFAERAAVLWKEPDEATDRRARRAWHDERFDPAHLDGTLLGIVTGT